MTRPNTLQKKAPPVTDYSYSDCDYDSHLHYFKNRKETIEHVKKNAYDSIAGKYKFVKI